MRIIKDIPQHLENGDSNCEWLAVRRGLFTASDFHQYMGLAKKDDLSDTAESNLYKKALESIGYDFPPQPISEAMARGTELEPLARQLYIEETFNDVHEVTFVDWERLRAGCSPDGVVYAPDGSVERIIEHKCPEIKGYLKMASGKIPPLYQTQVQMQLLITGAKACDFVVWHPDMRLVIREITPDADYQAEIVVVLKKLNARYDAILREIEQYKK